MAPAGTGIAVEPGARLVLQMHYYLDGAEPGVIDETTLDFMLADAVEREGFILPVWDPLWVSARTDPDFGLYIPAGERNVTHGFSIDPTAVFAGLYERRFNRPSPLPAGEPMMFYSGGIHMHTLGSGASASIRRGSDDPACLFEIPNYDFNWQDNFFLAEPEILVPGNRLAFECRFDNSPQNQPVVDGVKQDPKDTYWGDSTLDEMCIGIFLVAPPPWPHNRPVPSSAQPMVSARAVASWCTGSRVWSRSTVAPANRPA